MVGRVPLRQTRVQDFLVIRDLCSGRYPQQKGRGRRALLACDLSRALT